MSDGSHFITRLLESVPELQDLHDVHVADNGEMLSHVFMGDVSRFAISKSGQFGGKRTLKRLLAFIEKEMRTSPA